MRLGPLKKVSLFLAVCGAAAVIGRCYFLWSRIKASAFAGSGPGGLRSEKVMLGAQKQWFDLEKGVTINNTVGRWAPGDQALDGLYKKAVAEGWEAVDKDNLSEGQEFSLKGVLLKRQEEIRFILPWRLPNGRKGAFDWTMDLAGAEAMISANVNGGDLPGVDIKYVPRMERWSRRFSMAGSGVNMVGYLSEEPYLKVAGEAAKLMGGKGWLINGSVTNAQGVWQSYRSGGSFCNLWAGNGGKENQTYIMMVKYGE